MNRALRKEIFHKTRLRNRFLKYKTKTNWEAYRIQRNKVTNLRRTSIKNYFRERCDSSRNIDFWATIKPFISTKTKTGSNLTIKHEDKLLTEPTEVADFMNSFYIGVADKIGTNANLPKPADHPNTADFVKTSCDFHSNHSSIKNINTKCQSYQDFNFTPITAESVNKVIKSLDPKKATGHDMIPAKSLIPISDIICVPMCGLFNRCLSTNTFPTQSKLAEVTPIFKKDDPQVPKNHRPVSILTSSSKVLEKLLLSQLAPFLDHVYHPNLSAFRKGYSCQHVLLDLCETWRKALENHQTVGMLLIDLSKAFDCLPYSLTVAKLRAYGLSQDATTLLANYLTGIAQRVKVKDAHSTWDTLRKGVPQGSILGPVIFNLFINDIYYAIKDGCIFNYADDNTAVNTGSTLADTTSKLLENCTDIMNWIHTNEMEANPSKFQVMFSDPDPTAKLTYNDTVIPGQNCVKLLGVHLDKKLTFSEHVSDLCRRAAYHINVLQRFKRILPCDVKLLLYKSFTLAFFNYCPAVWHQCGKVNSQKLERLQCRALRFVFSDFNSTYEQLLKRANLPSLELNRLRAIALEVYKAYNDINPPYINSIFQDNKKSHNYNLRSQGSLTNTHSRSNAGLHSFKHTGINIWNNLPSNLRETTDYSIFKKLIKSWTGVSCKCSLCKRS